MKRNIYLYVTTQVALTAIAIMALSFVPDLLRDFFGDWHCEGSKYDVKISQHIGCQYGDFSHGPTWHWGFRHWVWTFMCIVLFIVNTIRIINTSEKGPSNV